MITRRYVLAATGGLAALTAGGHAIAAATPGVAGKRGGEAMQITRSGSQPSRIGPPENFTGAVRVDSPFRGTIPPVSAARSSPSSLALAPPGTPIRSARR